jgi:guanylate kinase
MAKVFVITGPSGVGKGTLISELMRRIPNLELSISATTRSPRQGEEDGRDYHFLSPEEFEGQMEADDFLEFATYSGHRYGTLRSEVEQRLSAGHSVVLEIEVQGAQQVRAAMPDSVQIFIAPPDPGHLRTRLEGRGTDSAEAIDSRLETAEIELAAQGDFDHRIVNDDISRAVGELEQIVRAEAGLPLDSGLE